MRVSVIIPTYKHGALLPATLDSVFAQTLPPYEVIVVNDASPDDTAERLRPLAAAGRIRAIERSVNGGQAAARNEGIAAARGDLIALLDDDDLWPPDKLSWQVEALRAHPEVGIVYGRPVCIDAAGEEVSAARWHAGAANWPAAGPSGHIHRALARRNWIVSPGQCLVRRSALDALDEPPFDTALWGCDDWDLWLRLAEREAFLFMDRVALCYRVHAGNASRDALRMGANSFALYAKHLRRSRRDPERHRTLRQARAEFRDALVDCCFDLVWEPYRRGDRRGAIRQAAALARRFPDLLLRKAARRALRWTAGGPGANR